jgi:hypothetical protein
MSDNINFREYGGSTRPVRFKDVGAGVMVPYHIIMDSSGSEKIGETTMSQSIPVVLPSNMPLLGRGIINVSANFTRPADTNIYAVGDLVANSTTAGSVTIMTFAITRYAQGGCAIRGGRFQKTGTSLTNADFRLHLYETDPTPANGDNGAWLTNNSADYLGYLETGAMMAFNDGCAGRLQYTSAASSDIFLKKASGSNVRGLIEARGTYTPISGEVFTCVLEVETT